MTKSRHCFRMAMLAALWISAALATSAHAEVTNDPGSDENVELKVTETDPALKGATAAAQYKPATLETGLKITVPPHIAIGDMVIVGTTEGGKYVGKAK